MKKLNCWEVMKCGREQGGKNVENLGICPAAVEIKAHGIHDGRNAGRCCWVVTGTFCEGKVQGTFALKFKNCANCPFYKMVTEEEDRYLTASEINEIIKKNTPK